MSELRLMIEIRRLHGVGIGLTDAHLAAAVFMNPPTLLWTKDKPLRKGRRSPWYTCKFALKESCTVRLKPHPFKATSSELS
jgi:hypothetical protein